MDAMARFKIREGFRPPSHATIAEVYDRTSEGTMLRHFLADLCALQCTRRILSESFKHEIYRFGYDACKALKETLSALDEDNILPRGKIGASAY